jgi:hypothetical protein
MKNAYLNTNREAPRRCPRCGSVNDAATHANLDGPTFEPLSVGAVGVCGHCAALLVVTADGSFRLGTDEDLARLDPDLQKLVRSYLPPHFAPRRES